MTQIELWSNPKDRSARRAQHQVEFLSMTQIIVFDQRSVALVVISIKLDAMHDDFMSKTKVESYVWIERWCNAR